LLNLAGGSLQQPQPLDGLDAWPTIVQGKPSPHDEILLNTTPRGGALRSGNWKLKVNIAAAPARRRAATSSNGGDSESQEEAVTIELYNLADDLRERQNVAAQHPDRVQELRARYDRLAAQALPPKNRPAD
jgi:hypothetical protein